MKLVVSVVPCAVEAADLANIPKDAYKHSDIVPLVAKHSTVKNAFRYSCPQQECHLPNFS
jgi:hypothetical protein